MRSLRVRLGRCNDTRVLCQFGAMHPFTILSYLLTGDPAVIALVEAGEPQHVEESEEEDVLEVVAKLKQRDAGLQAALPSTADGNGIPFHQDEESDEVLPG